MSAIVYSVYISIFVHTDNNNNHNQRNIPKSNAKSPREIWLPSNFSREWPGSPGYLADPRSPKPDIIFMDVCLVPREPPIDRMNQCTMLTAR